MRVCRGRGHEERGGRGSAWAFSGAARHWQPPGTICALGRYTETHLESHRVPQNGEDVEEQDALLGEICVMRASSAHLGEIGRGKLCVWRARETDRGETGAEGRRRTDGRSGVKSRARRPRLIRRGATCWRLLLAPVRTTRRPPAAVEPQEEPPSFLCAPLISSCRGAPSTPAAHPSSSSRPRPSTSRDTFPVLRRAAPNSRLARRRRAGGGVAQAARGQRAGGGERKRTGVLAEEALEVLDVGHGERVG